MIITVCPKSDNGVNTHLKELENVTGMTKHIQIERYAIKACNQIKKLNPKLIIFGGAWNPCYEYISQRIKCKKGILFCSPLGQAELSNELPYLAQTLEMKKNGQIDYIFAGSKDFELIFKDVIWLPQTFDVNQIKINDEQNKKEGNVVIGATAPHKNLVNTIAGISLSKHNKITTNVIKENQVNVLQHMNILIDNKGFLSKKDYYNMIRDSKLGFQLSDDESFDYVVLEHMLLRTPIMIGRTISKHYKDKVSEPFLVNDIHNSVEIAEKINKIYSLSDEAYDRFCDKFYEIGMEVITDRNDIARSILSKILNSL